MRRSLALGMVMLVFLGPLGGSAATRGRIKWIASIYFDAEGKGLKHPEGVACGDDYLMVADTANRRILQYSVEKESVTPKAEFPLPKSYPLKVQVSPRGDVYFLDSRERRIAKLDSEGEGRELLKPRGLPFSSEVVPKSFAIGGDEIFLLDILSEQVVILDSEGEYRRGIPFPKSYGFFSDVTVGADGRVFILDSVEAVVYATEAGGAEFSVYSESLREYVNLPTSLALDAGGLLYVLDQAGSGLALVGPSGVFLGRKLGLGWKESALYYPSQICISGNGNMFIADRNNSRVQRFSLGSGETGAKGRGSPSAP